MDPLLRRGLQRGQETRAELGSPRRRLRRERVEQACSLPHGQRRGRSFRCPEFGTT